MWLIYTALEEAALLNHQNKYNYVNVRIFYDFKFRGQRSLGLWGFSYAPIFYRFSYKHLPRDEQEINLDSCMRKSQFLKL